jgi:hypothetical protein
MWPCETVFILVFMLLCALPRGSMVDSKGLSLFLVRLAEGLDDPNDQRDRESECRQSDRLRAV